MNTESVAIERRVIQETPTKRKHMVRGKAHLRLRVADGSRH